MGVILGAWTHEVVVGAANSLRRAAVATKANGGDGGAVGADEIAKGAGDAEQTSEGAHFRAVALFPRASERYVPESGKGTYRMCLVAALDRAGVARRLRAGLLLQGLV